MLKVIIATPLGEITCMVSRSGLTGRGLRHGLRHGLTFKAILCPCALRSSTALGQTSCGRARVCERSRRDGQELSAATHKRGASIVSATAKEQNVHATMYSPSRARIWISQSTSGKHAPTVVSAAPKSAGPVCATVVIRARALHTPTLAQ